MKIFENIKAYYRYKIDNVKNKDEYSDSGKTGERILYNTLKNDLKVPEDQIFRNVYIPYDKNKTSEIDLLVVSKKGIFVFECKNYCGKIYGDAKYVKWIQYIGNEKHEFYSPLFQNKAHAKRLNDFLNKNEIEIPIIPLVSAISRGKWKIRNLHDDDYVLGINCHLMDIYNELPDSDDMSKNFNRIIKLIKPLERPDEEVRKKHIKQVVEKQRKR